MKIGNKFKIISVVLCLGISVPSMSVFAEWRQSTGNKIIISNKIESGEKQRPVTINVLTPEADDVVDKDEIIFHAQTLTDENGEYEFLFQINKNSGNYKAVVNEDGKLSEEIITFVKESVVNNPGLGGTSGGSSGTKKNSSSTGIPIIPVVTENTEPTELYEDIFVDLDEAKWAKEAIVNLAELGIVNGRTSDTFCPNDKMKREEFTKIIVDAFLKDAQTGKLPFDDTDQNAWYYPYVVKAYNSGAVSGKSDKFFGIGEYITREDMSVILYRILKDNFKTPAEEHIFADSDEISDYAKESIMVFYDNDIISGMGDNCFSPKTYATRAQVAKIVSDILAVL